MYIYTWKETKIYPITKHKIIKTYGLTVEGKREIIKHEKERF